MARWVSGFQAAGPVSLRDPRAVALRELLLDLSLPGVCVVLGAGASHGLVPMRITERMIYEKMNAYASFPVPTQSGRRLRDAAPEVEYLRSRGISVRGLSEFNLEALLSHYVLPSLPGLPGTIVAVDMRAHFFKAALAFDMPLGRVLLCLHDFFTPKPEIPPSLVSVYDVVENQDGVIVDFNYDGISMLQSRFPVIAPHGRRSELLADPELREALANGRWAPTGLTNLHLPVPETEAVRCRPGYAEMVDAWRCARAVAFVGYAFGGGADEISFADFGEHLNREARIHVLCPRPDNADLCKQVGYPLRGRIGDFRVFGQPFSWRAFAEAILKVLAENRWGRAALAVGKEYEILREHDRAC